MWGSVLVMLCNESYTVWLFQNSACIQFHRLDPLTRLNLIRTMVLLLKATEKFWHRSSIWYLPGSLWEFSIIFWILLPDQWVLITFALFCLRAFSILLPINLICNLWRTVWSFILVLFDTLIHVATLSIPWSWIVFECIVVEVQDDHYRRKVIQNLNW